MDYLLLKIDEIFTIARDYYGVNPIIFLLIYLSCTPVFYYSLFRTIQAVTKKSEKGLLLWSAVFMCVTIAPFVYVLFFGKNIPWWVFVIIAILLGQGIFTLIRNIRQNKPLKIQGKI